jgi:hypothetical protein
MVTLKSISAWAECVAQWKNEQEREKKTDVRTSLRILILPIVIF